jgi:hypothetical protein
MHEQKNISFNQYMAEQKLLSRWQVLKIGLAGMFAGVCLAMIWSLVAVALK